MTPPVPPSTPPAVLDAGTWERLAINAGPGACMLVVAVVSIIVLFRYVISPLVKDIREIGAQHASMASDAKAAALIAKETAATMSEIQASMLAISQSMERNLARAESLVDKLLALSKHG